MARYVEDSSEPVVEREVVREAPRDREVIVTNSGPGPERGFGGIIAAVVGVIVLLVVAYFLVTALGVFNGGGGDGPSVEIPSELNINVDPGNG